MTGFVFVYIYCFTVFNKTIGICRTVGGVAVGYQVRARAVAEEGYADTVEGRGPTDARTGVRHCLTLVYPSRDRFLYSPAFWFLHAPNSSHSPPATLPSQQIRTQIGYFE